MAKKRQKKTAKTTGNAASKQKRPAKAGAARRVRPRADADSIRQLVELMVKNDLNEVNIADGQTRILLRRGGLAGATGAAAAPAEPPAASQSAAEAATGEELIEIKSPMVGTFFAAPSPDSEPYVKVGAGVSEDTVVCVVEAMKVMNEIKAECTGTVTEICIKNAQPVEFGQALFKVKSA